MTTQRRDDNPPTSVKDEQLRAHAVEKHGSYLTTDQGIPVEDTDNSLKVGQRGATLLEDFHLREKLTRFDHERIPERVVHARGSGAHGYFQAYDDSLAEYTTAEFLRDPLAETPVFVRFSTVQGPRGSADTVRDVRGFATKFYTSQGNFDLVGNNIPVFFIQDGIKFPDFVHAVKMEPHNEIPTGASAHDTFWDFVSLQPETMHMIMWLMSDRAIPRSFATMQGFGVHSFRLINAEGRSTFAKFHWTPKRGVQSLVWDEAQQIAGRDPDFNRRDLWELIEAGRFPEYELGLQLFTESDAERFDFDVLDPTKIVPEERVPVRPVGRLVLNRNPDNFFAETEQVAFCVQNVVPGIGFTDDPLMQARLFSYLDTQLTRLGGPNFASIPINRPIAPVVNHQQDGFHYDEVPRREANYHPNSISDGYPKIPGENGYVHYPELEDGRKLRRRPESFADHYGQATLFWNSMSAWEKKHIVEAYRFELGHVERRYIRERVVDHLNHVDHDLAVAVAAGVGVAEPAKAVDNHGRSSPALSQTNKGGRGIKGLRIAFLVTDGVDAASVTALRDALRRDDAVPELLAPADGTVRTTDGASLPVDRAISTVASVLYDAVVVPDGTDAAAALRSNAQALHFLAEAYKHAKPLAALGAGTSLFETAHLPPFANGLGGGGAAAGVVAREESGAPDDAFVTAFVTALEAHRFYDRPLETVVA
ncbi:catalase [Planosporangium thailandense]|uniref:Catalase n=1 Tax=Planosporangium thailandense TaxID=765197 RepID=A0ABX0XYH4_9ACTN|nr:catalase [Planosporangium thailandense]NJC70435.1 catalase [Planosporangium thailandense]